MQNTLIVPRQRYRGPYMSSVLRPTLIEPVRYVYPSYADDYYGNVVPYGEDEAPPADAPKNPPNPPTGGNTPTPGGTTPSNEPVPVPAPAPTPAPAPPNAPTGLLSLFTSMQRTTFIIIVLILLLFLCVMIK